MDSNGLRGDGNGAHHEEEIVIVGGGIGGLACALAFHRVGIRAVVLEQSDALRASGAALALWSNAFRVLEVLGIAEQFRTMFTNLLAYANHSLSLPLAIWEMQRRVEFNSTMLRYASFMFRQAEF
jgi:2-polyprenyl-6-methoxyphenol hydroxylase-like FAD-dependent oxidoreductase